MYIISPNVYTHFKNYFLSHHVYSDFIHHGIEIPTTYLKFEIQKLLKATLEFGNHFKKHYVQK